MCDDLDDGEDAGSVTGVVGCGVDDAVVVGSDGQNSPKIGSLGGDQNLEGLFLEGRVCPTHSVV